MAEVGGYVSLADSQLLTQSELLAGLAPTIVVTGGVMERLPVHVNKGLNLTYNQQNVQPTGSFHAIADAWTASQVLDITQVTVTLARHGDQFNLDQFAKKAYSNVNDLQVILAEEAGKGLRREIEGRIIYESTEFSGLHSLVTAGQTVNSGSGTTGAAMGATNLSKMIDRVLLGDDNEHDLVLPRQLALRIDAVGNSGTTNFPVIMVTQVAESGGMKLAPMASTWRNTQIRRNNQMVMTETISGGAYSAKTGGATGTAFCYYPGLPLTGGVFLAIVSELFEKIGPFVSENGDYEWFRLRSYLATGKGSPLGLAALDGNTDVALAA